MKIHTFFVLLILFFILSVKCTEDKVLDSEPVKTQAPYLVAPTQPGFISANPNILYLHKGETHQFNVKLFDSDGNLLTQPTFFWTSLIPEIISVSGDGIVTALKEGFGQVSVTDNLHGIRVASILVVSDTANIPAKPISIEFNPPVVTLETGQTETLSFTLTDGGGNIVSGYPVQFIVTGNQGISITPSGIVSASTPGSAKINAVIMSTGDTLSQILIVNAWNEQTGGSGQCSESNWIVNGVYILDVPFLFTKPGLIANPVRVEVTEICTTSKLPSFRIRQMSPASIEFSEPNVASLNGNGLIISNNPGVTGFNVKMSEQVYDCGLISVYPSLQGKWSVASNTGDSGVVSINSWPSQAYYSNSVAVFNIAFHGVTGYGEGCFWKNSTQEFCEGSASVTAFINGSGGLNVCDISSLEQGFQGAFNYCWRTRHSNYDPSFFWDPASGGIKMLGLNQPNVLNGISCLFKRDGNVECRTTNYNLTGNWLLSAGTSTCSYQGVMTLQQVGQILSGSYWLSKVSGPSLCFTSISGSLSGEINGIEINIGLATSGGDNYSFLGTIESDGNKLVGTWTSNLLSGTWSAERNN